MNPGQFYKVDKEAILKFRDTKDTTVTLDIDPISNENQKAAYNKDRSAMLFVLLNFLDENGKVVLPKDRKSNNH